MLWRHPIVVGLVVGIGAPLVVAGAIAFTRTMWAIYRAVTDDLPDSIEKVSARLTEHMAAEEAEASDRQRWRDEVESMVKETRARVKCIEAAVDR